MFNDFIKQELKSVFAGIIADHGGKTEAMMLLEKFEIAERFSERFWTANYLDDLIVNEGSGIYIPTRTLLKLYSRFVSRLSLNTYGAMVTASISGSIPNPAWEFYDPWSDICKLVAGQLQDQLHVYRNAMTLSKEEAAYHMPVFPGKGEDLEAWIGENAWLVPLYLLFASGALKEVIAEIKPA